MGSLVLGVNAARRAALVEHSESADVRGGRTMLRTFSGRQPHPRRQAPQPGSDDPAAAAAPRPLPERTGTPSQDAGVAPDAAARVDLPAGEEPPPGPAPSRRAGEWEAQLAALEAAKAAKRASSAPPLVDDCAPAGVGGDGGRRPRTTRTPTTPSSPRPSARRASLPGASRSPSTARRARSTPTKPTARRRPARREAHARAPQAAPVPRGARRPSRT